ncbi:MAG: UDP-glucose--hexose-1-phosphate uridylyltransferase [Clostridium sp.]|uniref:UDP-glucose--hexose-1-phosphate uridylyltransferase n=1 Tax=Clostridium sp. TaxID=1506 RepID=UPI00321760E9
MNSLYSLINRLIEISIDNKLIEPLDEIYVRNRFLSAFNECNYSEISKLSTNFPETLEQLTGIAVEKGIINDYLYEKDIFSSNLMNCFLDKPSVINKNFQGLYKTSPAAATDYFYNLSKNSNYIKMDRIAKNVFFKTPSIYGDIDITINLSKPEKDSKQIALEKNVVRGNYPKCLLCRENEGYDGTITHPDRGNHRTISLDINNKAWRLQYSPYVYYNEHCIVLLDEHEPMHVSKETFKTLLSFVEIFPHYFLGSNAGLPIVGGSILAHEHYQGGNYIFPMNRAKNLFSFKLKKYDNIEITALQWPLSTLRLRCKNVDDLVECGGYIFDAWQNYSDEEHHILASTEGNPHNAITPICRKEDEYYIMDLALRNNRTTEEFPDGIFHPHKDVQHIKKENIGLIEVMGLAILPGRLKTELEDIKNFVICDDKTAEENFSKIAAYHKPWAVELREKYNSDVEINRFIEINIGNKFVRVLEDAGVFKQTPHGIDGFKKFADTIGAIYI